MIKRLFSFSKSLKSFKIGKLNHIAVAVPDMQKSSTFYNEVLGADVSEEILDLPEHGVSVCFVNLENTKIELIHPYGENSPIEGFLKKNENGGIHHLCYEVENIYEAIETIAESGVRVLNEEPKIGAHGNPIVFLHPKDTDGVLIEIEESGGDI